MLVRADESRPLSLIPVLDDAALIFHQERLLDFLSTLVSTLVAQQFSVKTYIFIEGHHSDCMEERVLLFSMS